MTHHCKSCPNEFTGPRYATLCPDCKPYEDRPPVVAASGPVQERAGFVPERYIARDVKRTGTVWTQEWGDKGGQTKGANVKAALRRFYARKK